jgi:hypothetical protein
MSPLGENFDNQGRSCHTGVNFVPWGLKLAPGGQSSPLGTNHVKNWPLVCFPECKCI